MVYVSLWVGSNRVYLARNWTPCVWNSAWHSRNQLIICLTNTSPMRT